MKQNNLTEGSIFKSLMKFAVPVLGAMFLQAFYGAVDLFVVGRFAETADVSGVATGSMFLHTVTCIVTGMTMGITVFVGQSIGEKNREKTNKGIGSGIFLFIIIAIIMTLAITLLADSFSSLMHAPKEAFDETSSYIMICGIGFVFVVSYNVLSGIFRGLGDSKTPLITVAVACIFNIIGDLILIAVFDMGAAGAAIATVGAQGLSVLVSILIIRKRTLPFDFALKYIKYDAYVVKTELKLGVPIALQDLLVGISFLVIQTVVNTMGVIASAGVGVAEKLCIFIMLLPSSYMQSMSAFVAQNIGAGEIRRANKALLYGIATSLTAGIVMACITILYGDIMASIFTSDEAVISAAFDYLKAYGIDCLFVAELFCFIGYFNGRGKTLFVMIQGIVGAFCVRVPVVFLMSKLPEASLFLVGLATPISTVVQITLCFIVFFAVVRRQDKKHITL